MTDKPLIEFPAIYSGLHEYPEVQMDEVIYPQSFRIHFYISRGTYAILKEMEFAGDLKGLRTVSISNESVQDYNAFEPVRLVEKE